MVDNVSYQHLHYRRYVVNYYEFWPNDVMYSVLYVYCIRNVMFSCFLTSIAFPIRNRILRDLLKTWKDKDPSTNLIRKQINLTSDQRAKMVDNVVYQLLQYRRYIESPNINFDLMMCIYEYVYMCDVYIDLICDIYVYIVCFCFLLICSCFLKSIIFPIRNRIPHNLLKTWKDKTPNSNGRKQINWRINQRLTKLENVGHPYNWYIVNR